MKITFQFNSKSSGQGVHDAISIAQKCKGSLEGRLNKVRFDTPEDKLFIREVKNLEKVYILTKPLSFSRLLKTEKKN